MNQVPNWKLTSKQALFPKHEDLRQRALYSTTRYQYSSLLLRTVRTAFKIFRIKMKLKEKFYVFIWPQEVTETRSHLKIWQQARD